MHIGLIGGIGPAATDFYYRRLIATFASKKAALELTIVHADTPTLLSNLASNNAAAQVAIYVRLTKRLVAAGAECVVVTSIAGHFCIDEFKVSSPLPVDRLDFRSQPSHRATWPQAHWYPRNSHRNGNTFLRWRSFGANHPAKRARLRRYTSSVHRHGDGWRCDGGATQGFQHCQSKVAQ